MHMTEVFPSIENRLGEYLFGWGWLWYFCVKWDLRFILWYMMITVIWIVTPCSLLGMYQYCRKNCCIIMVITSIPDCMASHPATVIFKCMLIHLHLFLTLLSKMLTTVDEHVHLKCQGHLKLSPKSMQSNGNHLNSQHFYCIPGI